MEVTLYRYASGDEGTIGILATPGFHCYTLEPPDRDNKPNLGRILYGEYEVKPRWSSKYREHFWVTKVKNRSYILIHPGNVAGDRTMGYKTHSWGCLLLGMSRGILHGQRAVFRSKEAVQKFKAHMQYEPFTLKITGGA